MATTESQNPRAVSLGRIRTTYDGYWNLIQLFYDLDPNREDACVIDLSASDWFEANMCSPLGAILHRCNHASRPIKLRIPDSRIRALFQRNGFLPKAGYDEPKQRDIYGTTIEFMRFNRGGHNQFMNYIDQQFMGQRIPKMSQGLTKHFRSSIAEIFDNADEHSQTEFGIYACGQYFRTTQRLDFSIVDLGIGIRRRILESLGLDLTPEKAIRWALEGSNTTRSGPRPGGLGRKLLTEFIALNGGKMQIISDAGYWELARGEARLRPFPKPFPGTIVTLEINASDEATYMLKSEKINLDDIF